MERYLNYTKVDLGESVQGKLLKGAIKLAVPVVETLGPGGRTVVIHNDEVVATKDGVTVARSITLGDPIENAGAQILKQVANQTQSKSGDGTTTATLLAMRIFEILLGTLNSEDNRMSVKKGMETAREVISNYVIKDSVLVDLLTDEGRAMIKAVAHIASNNDEVVASLVSKAIDTSMGTNPIKVEMARENSCYVESYEGMVYYNSVLSPLFLENMDSTGELHLKRARVFITDFHVMNMMDLSGALEYYVDRVHQGEEKEIELVVIAPEMSEEALRGLGNNMVKYKYQGKTMKVIALKAPGMGQEMIDQLRDMATFVGGVPILKSDFANIDEFGDLKMEEILGTCEVKIKRDQYSIINGQYDKKAMDLKIKYLSEMYDEEESGYMRDRIAERKAKLLGNISVIFVGANSPLEAKEIYDRVDDAVNAVKGAIEGGVVKGGGVALLKASMDAAEHKWGGYQDTDAFHKGFDAVLMACRSPFERILGNAERDVEQGMELVVTSGFKKIYDVIGGNEVDILEQRIVDPRKVTISALDSAVSVASVFMSTRTTIINHSETIK